MKKNTLAGIFIGILCMALLASTAQAVPSLGVATNVAYVGTNGQTALEPYQDYFVNSFIPGTDQSHGFVIGASGSNLTVFTNMIGPNIYLLWSSSTEASNGPTFVNPSNGTTYVETHFGMVGQFDGYTPADYYGILLGPVSTAAGWVTLPNSPFEPSPFYAFDVQLYYSGIIASGQYFFAIADTDGGGPSGNGNTSPNYDPFSPKTTSATGAPVPEPGTLMLLGSGLIGLAGFGRKRLRK